jgi:type I restriction enzyme, S subunit
MEKLDSILKYYQPTTFIVEKDDYDDNYKTPVLTAGKSFILGYTKEETGIFSELPAIIFDDFTASFHYVDFPFKVKSSAMKILVPRNENIDLRYVYYRMQGLRVDTELHKRYWISIYSQFPIPLPPLETQKRIAQILDDAQALKSKTELLLKEYDALAQSIFLDMFGDPVTNPKGWDKIPLNILGKVTTGNTPSRNIPEYFGDYIEWIKTDNINTPNTTLTKANEYLSEKGLQVGRVVEKGSILVTCIAGSRRVIGNVAIADRKVSFNQQINAFSSKNGITMFWYYQFIIAKEYVQNFSTNGMKGIITKGKFEQIQFVNPPINLQNQFAEKIALIEQQKELAKMEIKESEDLFNCLMQKAFKGEIVCK